MLNPKPKAARRDLGRATPESLGLELLQALPTVRIHSVSLHDREGEALWLSEGALGPDEHSAVLEAMSMLSLETARATCAVSLGDGRSGAFLAVRSPQGDLQGVAMAVTDSRALDALGEATVASPPLRAVLQRLAEVLASRGGPGPAPATPVAASAIVEQKRQEPELRLAEPPRSPELVLELEPEAAPELNLSIEAGELVLESTITIPPPAPPAAPAADAPTRLMRRPDASGLTLFVQRLLKLRSGGRTRRYEVLLRSRREPAARDAAPEALIREGIDEYVIEELLGWLARHRETLENEPASFSVNLCTRSLLDDAFPAFVAARLRETRIAPGLIGFEVSQNDCIEHRSRVEKLIGVCERLGCYVVLDDFTLHSEAVPLLASKAVQVVKIDPKLTAAAMSDKLSQALVIAISQACKVLGSHCVAKRIETNTARQWLAAVGVDFAQGFLLEKPVALESLAVSA